MKAFYLVKPTKLKREFVLIYLKQKAFEEEHQKEKKLYRH